jgi:pimeloyl-ACP methyl ester carboxylesterase
MGANSQGEAAGNYADVNGLKMYYEVHGEGEPLVLLHGSMSNVQTDFGRVLPGLAASRRVIGVEQQAHGHTADIDRPLSYEQMADDTAELLRGLGIERADFFGYSMGGAVAMHIARRHPELVRKFVFGGGTGFHIDGYYPELVGSMGQLKPEYMFGTPWHDAYMKIAPNPDDFATLIAKKNEVDKAFVGWTAEEVREIKAPALLMIGDSDITRPEHIAEMFRLFGGGVVGDMVGLPASQLAVLPGTTHVTFVEQADWIVSMVLRFLDAPVPETR